MNTIYVEATDAFRNAMSEMELIESAKSLNSKIRQLKKTSLGFCEADKVDDIIFVMRKNKDDLSDKDKSNLGIYISIKKAFSYYRYCLQNVTTQEHPKISYQKALASGAYKNLVC